MRGIQTLTSSLLLVSAIAGLSLLESQIQVFSFGDTGIDARFFPRIVLGLLVLAVLIRLFVHRKTPDMPLGYVSSWLRVGLAAAAVTLGLFLMPSIGFLASAALSGFVTALAFGERRLMFSVGLPLAVAAIVSFGAREGLNIPLP
ncbi:MAG: tripartite tricarboxylate transporter TctB family protein [Oceanospirillaceae bacterium]|nr:tripartite tricarboxylate transporter TctB family protein [Oceanospirillaceae bacterium]